ncbi:MAG: type II toxin-antitoxin system PemK/MazF family toxin [Alcaligenaceae bacterium]|nr:type II toxin-antitoxin system PemK/MazF family toxin [Alcaligenaceae bacterium]
MVDQNKKNSALQIHLKTGELVICSFDTGFMAPEMIKTRPVLVISKSSTHWRGLCTVIPFSTTPPEKVERWHVLVRNPLHRLLPPSQRFAQATEMWAKCDMITTIGFSRITRPYDRQNGSRKYVSVRLSDADLDAVFAGVRAYLPAGKQQ